MPDPPKDPSSLAEQYVAAIVESADDAIISKNLDSIGTTLNPAAEPNFGYTPKEIIGQTLIRNIPPELGYEEGDNLNKVPQGEPRHHFETRRVRKDGTAINVSLTISP